MLSTSNVTVHVTMYTDTIIGTAEEVWKGITAINVTDLTTTYSSFRRMMADEGFEISEESSYRLFQIITEILCVRLNDLEDAGFIETTPFDRMLVNISEELSYSIHTKFFKDIDFNDDTLVDILAISNEVLNNNNQYTSAPGEPISLPLQWNKGPSVILLSTTKIS